VNGDGDNYDAIEEAAFQRYVLDLMRGWAAEQDRLWERNRGSKRDPRIVSIELVKAGTADAAYKVTVEHLSTGKITTPHFPLHAPAFYDSQGNRERFAGDIVSDILMWARGG
jgi:hypothetical protein